MKGTPENDPSLSLARHHDGTPIFLCVRVSKDVLRLGGLCGGGKIECTTIGPLIECSVFLHSTCFQDGQRRIAATVPTVGGEE